MFYGLWEKSTNYINSIAFGKKNRKTPSWDPKKLNFIPHWLMGPNVQTLEHRSKAFDWSISEITFLNNTTAWFRSEKIGICNVWKRSLLKHKLPLICVPKSILQTSSYCRTVLSPALGVKWAAQWLMEQPVGNARPIENGSSLKIH